MTARSITLMLLVTSAFSIACESTRVTESVQPGVDPPGLDPSVFTTLEVLPSTVTLEQGSTVQLGIVARDQRGVLMADAGAVTFSSSDPAIATVSGSGMVTGVAAGTADILVTKTAAGVTRSAKMKATTRRATPSDTLVITADLQRGWQPSVAHLTVGGTVKWVTAGPRSWSDVPHRMLYLMDKGYTIVDSLDLSTGSATLKLLTEGEYRYCSAGCWDPPDGGIVYVH
ncbi:MAG: Ig-like domain-containing protein [Gemmatimonadaceae bacterium]|nr:Ig-like domain-containing protein [Gemmatimonadaceae bacterium]MDQ3517584.1 Ig-like domain-containing protein [Gemmatimonadota bacterium]